MHGLITVVTIAGLVVGVFSESQTQEAGTGATTPRILVITEPGHAEEDGPLDQVDRRQMTIGASEDCASGDGLSDRLAITPSPSTPPRAC